MRLREPAVPSTRHVGDGLIPLSSSHVAGEGTLDALRRLAGLQSGGHVAGEGTLDELRVRAGLEDGGLEEVSLALT